MLDKKIATGCVYLQAPYAMGSHQKMLELICYLASLYKLGENILVLGCIAPEHVGFDWGGGGKRHLSFPAVRKIELFRVHRHSGV